ncbi:uncharacterized protein LOC111254543 [Varroa destructor]|uniref:Cuticle protein n=1 Tax=Varroa destructor TaxID=109461 RepID=A0A7M7KVI3_VARDE|nr:uncharacterized protein LOC111254543 [Varroa destructor]
MAKANKLQLGFVVYVAALSASQAAPPSRLHWTVPPVRAAPAFEDNLFSPTVGRSMRENDAYLEGNSVQNNGPFNEGAYSFSYDVQAEDGGHSRQETRDANGTITGSYTIALADGRRRTVEYIADADGFRARINTNEPGTGDDAPADVQWNSSAEPTTPVARPPDAQPGAIGEQQPPSDQKKPFIEDTRPPTHITSRLPTAQQPVETVALIPIATSPGDPDEPRSPHHPPRDFLPPNPPSTTQRAPAQPINIVWAQPIAFASAPWQPYFSTYPSGIVQIRAPYSIIKKKK